MEFFDYTAAFSRNIGIYSDFEQSLLRTKRIAIPGCGGVGGIHALCLARSGISNFNIADFDAFELPNFNRQYGAKVSTLNQEKTGVIAREIQDINPTADVRSWKKGIDATNIAEFLHGVDVVVDSLDFFAFEARRVLYAEARRRRIPVVTAGPMGMSCALLVFTADGMSFDDYFDIQVRDSDLTKAIKFAMGLAPRGLHLKYIDSTYVDLEAHKGPSTAASVTLCAAVATTEAIRLLLGRRGVRAVPHYAQFDPYLHQYKQGYLWLGNRNPWQKIKAAVAKQLFVTKGKRQRTASAAAKYTEAPNYDVAVRSVLTAGMQAPSGDNCQPFKFNVTGRAITITHVEDRGGHALNYANIASFITLGCVLENMRVAAAEHGLRTSSEFLFARQLQRHAGDQEWAKVELIEDRQGTTRDRLADALFARHVDRRPFLPSQESLTRVSELVAAEQPGQGLQLHTVQMLSVKLINLLLRLEKSVWQTKSSHKDLMRWVRFSQSSAAATRDGMPLATLGVSRGEGVALWLARSFLVQRLMNPLGALQKIAAVARHNILSSSGFVLVSGEGATPHELVEAGRVMQRIWLQCNAAGFGVQPLSLIPMGLSAIASGHQSALHRVDLAPVWHEAGEELRAVFGIGDRQPLWLFRVGKASTPTKSLQSLRRHIA